MTLGYTVSRATIDTKAAQACVELRNAFDHCHVIANWLNLYPIPTSGPNTGVDPIIAMFSYSTDEAADLRTVFAGFDASRTSLAYNFSVAQNITGLD